MRKVTPRRDLARILRENARGRILPPLGRCRYGIARFSLSARRISIGPAVKREKAMRRARRRGDYSLISIFRSFAFGPSRSIWTYTRTRARGGGGGEGMGKKRKRNGGKTSSKHVDATAPRNYRAVYWIRERGARRAAATAERSGWTRGWSEWSGKLFTKFPDSAGYSAKMQTPRLIPRLIEVCDYCRGELCRRA